MKPNINEIMLSMPLEWRYRWCESKACCCLGCVNRAGGIEAQGFTKEDWLEWVNRNPKPKDIKDPIIYSNEPWPEFNKKPKLP